jgi:hypothetical protein
VKFGTAAFPAQQLSLHSSFPCTASQPQPKQTGPKTLLLRVLCFAMMYTLVQNVIIFDG